MSRAAMALAVIAFAVACAEVPAEGPPDLAYGEIECSHCRMLVSEARYAAAVRDQGEDLRVFDDLGCLVAWARGGEHEITSAWVHDYDGGHWLRAEDAQYSSVPGRATPMGSGLQAYESPPLLPSGVGEALYDWTELLEAWEAPVRHAANNAS